MQYVKVVVTGPPNVGKGILAMRLMHALREAGHNNITYFNNEESATIKQQRYENLDPIAHEKLVDIPVEIIEFHQSKNFDGRIADAIAMLRTPQAFSEEARCNLANMLELYMDNRNDSQPLRIGGTAEAVPQ